MTSLSGLFLIVVMLGCTGGLLGLGRILAPGRMHGSCLTLSPPPPLPYLVLKNPVAQTLRILVEPHLIDAEFRKAWMPFLCRSGHLVVTVTQFLAFVGSFFHRRPSLIFHLFLARSLWRLPVLKSLLLVVWMVGPGMRLKPHPLPWFSGLAIFLKMVEPAGIWPHGLLDVFFAVIQMADGDSTPLGQRTLSVLPEVYRLWESLRLGHLRGLGSGLGT